MRHKRFARFAEKHWFLRGVQSAIFYYVSCTPLVEYKYKRKRRAEAARATKAAHDDVVNAQPGLIRQPTAFQTNEDWGEELLAGPGPPKGWKPDELLNRLKKQARGNGDAHRKNEEIAMNAMRNPSRPEIQLAPPILESFSVSPTTSRPSQLSSTLGPSNSRRRTDSASSITSTEPTSLSTSSAEGSMKESNDSPSRRPSMERRLSNALENIKESLRTTLHPSGWNWKRYEREDEVLPGFGDRLTQMWAKVTSSAPLESEPGPSHFPRGRKRAPTADSDRYDYFRAINPAVNDLHPPVVSSLPPTRDAAAWMLLPPPSALVMEGKIRPGAETGPRWPLALIGRTKDEVPIELPQRVVMSSTLRQAFTHDSEDWDDVGIYQRPIVDQPLSMPT